MEKKKECQKSQTSKHEWIYPRLEDSIDKNRQNQTYCKHCFIKNEENIVEEKLLFMFAHRTFND